MLYDRSKPRLKLSTKLRPYQWKALIKAWRRKTVAIHAEQGTGKTLIALALASRIASKKSTICNVLIVGPKVSSGVWEDEIAKHLQGSIAFRDIDSYPTIKKFSLLFTCINYERTWRRTSKLRKTKWDLIVCDESHRIRAPTSKQSIACGFHLKAPYKLAMTGTPKDKDDSELWPQYRFLSHSFWGNKWTIFRNRYCWVDNYQVLLRPSFRKEFLKRLAPYTFYISQKEALPHLPKMTIQKILFDLDPKTRKIYDQMQDEYVAEFDEHTCTTTISVTKMLRLQQICGGFLPDDDGDIHKLPQTKLANFIDFMADIRQPFVVFATFIEELKALQDSIKRRTALIRGGTKNAVELSKRLGKSLDGLIVQTQSGKESLDFTGASVGIFYSTPLSYIDYDQARKRLKRGGQSRRVHIYHMCARNTIDIKNVRRLSNKKAGLDELFRALKE